MSRHARAVLLACALCAGCSESVSRDPAADLGPGADLSPPGLDTRGPADAQTSPDLDSGRPDAGSAAHWILSHFAGAPVLSGSFASRTKVEAPHLVQGATGTGAKYAFDIRDESAPNDKEVGFVDVKIDNLVSPDAYGAGILTGDPRMVLYLARVHVEPNWPMWDSYATTNKDGIVLDGSTAFYAEDLTIKGFNADAGIDNKAPVSQMVRLTIDGPGNRSIRYWGDGPHYLVDSSIDNPGTVGDGALVWFQDCASVKLLVYGSTFNGAATIPPGKIKCESGSGPQITYLATDPRTTGEMHPMFVAP